MQKIPSRRLLCYAFQIIKLAHLARFLRVIPPQTLQNALWTLYEICSITNITFTISFNEEYKHSDVPKQAQESIG